MRILQINKFFYLRGGSEQYFFNLIKLLTAQHHQVIPFSMQHPLNLDSAYAKYFIPQIDFQAASSRLQAAGKFIKNKQAAERLEKLIMATKPQIAHLHNIAHQLTPAIIPVLKKYQIPIVQTVHDYQVICPNYLLYTQGQVCQRCFKKKYYQAIFNRCINRSYLHSSLAAIEMYYNRFFNDYLSAVDTLISPSLFLKKVLEKWKVQKTIIHLPNFVDLPEIAPQPMRNYYLYFGRLSPEKGILTLIQAFKKIPQTQLIIAGTGPLKFNYPKNVKLVGFKCGIELWQLVQQARAVIVPSEWYENNPLSVLEAQALKKWVIAAKIGGLAEMIDEGKNGALFKPGNVADLLRAIKSVKPVPSKIYNYTASQHYQKLMSIYQPLCVQKK